VDAPPLPNYTNSLLKSETVIMTVDNVPNDRSVMIFRLLCFFEGLFNSLINAIQMRLEPITIKIIFVVISHTPF